LLAYHLFQSSSPTKPQAYWGAIIAGVAFAFGSSKLFYVALGQFNIASTHWIPFTILGFITMHQHPQHWRWAACTALFLSFQAWTELTYASFLIIFMALYWLYWLLAQSPRTVISWPYLRSVGLLIALFILGISPFLAVMLPEIVAEGDLAAAGNNFADVFSSDLFGFLVPTMHHPLFGHLIQTTGVIHFDKGQQIYLGYTLLLLAAWGLYQQRRRPQAWFWLLSSLVFALLMLGPQIIINGTPTGIAGPFELLQTVPIFNLNRYPSRYSVLLLLSLAMLAGLAVSNQRTAVSSRRSAIRGLVLISLILFENVAIPLPQSTMTVPLPYQTIAQDAANFTVLDFPLGWRNGFRVTGAHTVGIMFGQFYQTTHQKPILGGNTSRNPELKFQYFTAAPILNSLKLLETGHDLPPSTWEQDRRYAAQVLRFFNIKYIVVRPEAPGYLNHPQKVIPYIEAVLPVEKLLDEPDFKLYQVQLPSLPKNVELVADSPMRRLYFAEGWGLPQQQIVAHRRHVRLLVPLNGQAQRVEFQVHVPDSSDNTMQLKLNDWQSDPIAITPQRQTVSLNIPATAVKAGLNEVFLHFKWASPFITEEVHLTVISAGEEGGNLAHIYRNGVDISPGKRGYNIALIDPAGYLIEAHTFDTHLGRPGECAIFEPAQSQALAEFIAQAPDDALIAAAIADEASCNLDQTAVAALQSLGSQIDLRGQFRASHALIANKADGLILEASDPFGHPAKVSTGLGLVEPNITAVFEAIRFVAVEPQ
jgi:hypothetical protein